MDPTNQSDHILKQLPWELIEKVLTKSGLGFWHLYVDDRGELMVDATDNLLQLIGRERQDFPGRFADYVGLCVHPDDQELLKRAAEGTKDSGWEGGLAYRLRRRADDRWIWVKAQGEVLETGAGGRIRRAFGCLNDIEADSGAEEKCRADEALARSLRVISERNETLARQLNERSKVINDIQQQVETLINDPGSRLDEVQMSIRQQMLNLKAAMAQDEEASDGGFSRYLKLGFQFIANERVWYKAVLDSLPFPTSVFDLARRWTYLNPAAAETMGGVKMEEVMGRHYAEGWKNYEDTDVRFQDGVTGKKTFTRGLPYSGRIFSGQSSFLLDEQRRPIGVIETMQDVTEAREADERIRLMLDTIPLACCLFSREAALLDCNRAAAGTCGLTDKRKYLQSFFELMPMGLPDGRKTAETLRQAIDGAFADGRAELKKFFLRSTRGINIPVEVHLIRLAWRDDFIVLGYFHDLRNLQEAKAELERERLILRDILG